MANPREGWYIRQFSEEEIRKYKNRRDFKDSHRWGNIFEGKDRWTGYPGEVSFRDFLNDNAIDHAHHNTVDEKDVKDFTVGNCNIDVKTVATTVDPKEYYGCEVEQSQTGNKSVDTYVFVRFNTKTNTAFVLGWLPKHEFLGKAISRLPGERVTGSFTVNTAMFEVKIDDLRPLSMLHEPLPYGCMVDRKGNIRCNKKESKPMDSLADWMGS